MSARLRSYSVKAFTLDTVEYLGDLRLFSLSAEGKTEDVRAINALEARKEIASMSGKFSFELFLTVGSVGTKRAIGVNVTAATIGTGNSVLANLESGTISIKNTLEEGAGIGSLFDFPNFVGSEVTIKESLLIPSSTLIIPELNLLVAGTLSALDVDLTLTIAGNAFALPVVIQSAEHTAEANKLQKYSVNLEQRGPMTGPASGGSTDGFVYSAFRGGALAPLVIDTGTGLRTVNTIIESADIQFSRGQIIKLTGVLMTQGQGTYVATTP